MSSHGRRRGGQGPARSGSAQFGWAVLVIAAALIGGLAAATLVHASVVIAVIVSVVVGGVALLVAFRSPSRPPELGAGADSGRYPVPPRQEAPASPWPSPPSAGPPTAPQAVPPAAVAADAPDPVAPASAAAPRPDGRARDTVVQLLPLPPEPGRPAPPWWDSVQGAPSPSPGAQRAPAPDLSTYLAATFIAQCPRCGAFRLDIHRGGNAWDFRCESCECTWTWQPGTPWPPVRVRPRERPPAP